MVAPAETVSDMDAAKLPPGAIRSATTHRVMIATAAVALLWPVWQVTYGSAQHRWAAAVGVLGLVGSLGTLLGAYIATRERTLARLDTVLLLLALIVLAGWTGMQLETKPQFATDEAAFIQYAATLLHHGSNPYGVSLAPAFETFQLPIS
jgi:hypothetical protein